MAMVFRSSPSLWSLYPKVALARKPAWVKEGASVPRIDAQLPAVNIDPQHLRAYRDICGAADGRFLPIAYPHVLASGLHLAVLSADAFPVKLLGLVHVRNGIRQHRPIEAAESGALHVRIEGHSETPRGQEFTLTTSWRSPDGELAWEEDCVFLARRRKSPESTGANAPRESDPAEASTTESAASGAPVAGMRTTSFRAPAGLGRSYGLLGGDLNPIHLSDLSARLFGFKAAIAHGMWSLARCASDLDAQLLSGACELSVAFKLPVYLPSWLLLEHRQEGNGHEFCLRDAEGQKPHLNGSLRSLA